MAGGEENYTRHVCTQIIAMAAKDAQNKVARASWVEPAQIWLSDSMQKAIADATDVPRKALVLQQKCDASAFESLKAATTPESYKVFCDGLAALGEILKSKQVA